MGFALAKTTYISHALAARTLPAKCAILTFDFAPRSTTRALITERLFKTPMDHSGVFASLIITGLFVRLKRIYVKKRPVRITGRV